MVPAGKRLVLFDGECNVCNGAVLFIIDRDLREEFLFAPLASDVGRRALAAHGLVDPTLDSLVLVEEGRAVTHSTAALRIMRRLSGLWPWLAPLLLLVPRCARDAVYRAFARRRYGWFGKTDHCRVPTPELRRRFLALS